MTTSGLNETPQANRPKLVIIGRRNAGKSSFINALTNQNIAIVSDVAGTTADPVYKNMEILPIGPVTIVDTAGLDDKGKLGKLRVEKTMDALTTADFIFFVISAETGIADFEKKIIEKLAAEKKRFCIIANKTDLKKTVLPDKLLKTVNCFFVSSKTGAGIDSVKDNLSKVFPKPAERFIISDLINAGDIVVLVVPIDLSAPKGRLILPQVQTIREILDTDAVAFVTKERELKYTLDNLKQPPKLVVTDSQAVMKVIADVPQTVKLTTFSVLFARYKGDIQVLIDGLKALKKLKNNDKILVIEACTHHPMPDDIGRIKIPRWLSNFTGKKLKFEFFAGKEIPKDLKGFKLGIHCGGCMLTQQEMLTRMENFRKINIPVVNYGIIISYIHNAFPRVLEPFPELIAQFR